ncbi:MAG: hypothetical protein M3N52_12125 [Actinomycetota bacterium]|nr:hypothetical protein [Actinomycetota bacterium]
MARTSFSSGGAAATTATATTVEALAAGDWVSIYDDAGAAKVRKAAAVEPGREAHGFVLADVASGQPATVHMAGINTAVAGHTPGGAVWLSDTPGMGAAAPPSEPGHVAQRVGRAAAGNAVKFEPSAPIELV